VAALTLVYLVSPQPALGGDQEAGPGPDHEKIPLLVEIFLAKDRKPQLESVRKEFAALSVTRVNVQFFRLGHPPENLAVGPGTPADVARLAIRMAKTYNDGVKYILAQYRFFPNHIAIGTSAFDEASQIPITPENVERLADPALTTEQFHTLYRQLTGEDRRLPTYLNKSDTP
jgi:hypothetical protein